MFHSLVCRIHIICRSDDQPPPSLSLFDCCTTVKLKVHRESHRAPCCLPLGRQPTHGLKSLSLCVRRKPECIFAFTNIVTKKLVKNRPNIYKYTFRKHTVEKCVIWTGELQTYPEKREREIQGAQVSEKSLGTPGFVASA